MKRWAALALVILLIAPLSASAQSFGQVERSVIGSGGSSSGRLMGTFGQPVATGPARLCAGFWCGDAPVAVVSNVQVLYRVTFGQVGSIAMLLTLAVLLFIHQVYQQMVQLWSRQRTSS